MPWTRLRRFFADRKAVSLPEAAALLGCDEARIAVRLDEGGVRSAENDVPWVAVAALAREILTPAELETVAGGTSVLPGLLRLSAVQWRLPAYLLIALEQAVAEERALDPASSRLTVEAFVARHLDLTLDPDMFGRLRSDPAFRRAFDFPEEDDE